MDELLQHVPPELQERFTLLVRLTDTFCAAHLNDEYTDLCRDMAVALCQKGSPVTRGKLEGWACGIVYTIGWVNFLTDPSQTPHVRSEDVARGFGVSMATMQSKSKLLRDAFNLSPLDPRWTLTSRLAENPLVWMLQTKEGFIFDVRFAPREVQAEALQRGLIPFMPPATAEDDE